VTRRGDAGTLLAVDRQRRDGEDELLLALVVKEFNPMSPLRNSMSVTGGDEVFYRGSHWRQQGLLRNFNY
jgi:hypothetical protein